VKNSLHFYKDLKLRLLALRVIVHDIPMPLLKKLPGSSRKHVEHPYMSIVLPAAFAGKKLF
jgi:hypothetical protein